MNEVYYFKMGGVLYKQINLSSGFIWIRSEDQSKAHMFLDIIPWRN